MIFAACALLALVAIAYVVYVQPETTPAPLSDPQLDYLLEKKAVLYDNLRDLNLEYRMGKLSDADYQRLKQQLQFEIGGVLQQVESHQAPPSAPPARYRPVQGVAEPRVARPAPTTERICPRCGATNSSRNKFCGECGEMIVEAAPESKQ